MPRFAEEDIERVLALDDIVRACPRVVSAVTEIAADPDATARDLARVISTDEALTTSVLKLANSAFFGLAGEVSTVTQAAVILGMREIKSLVYSVPVSNLYRTIGDGALDPEALWDHSISVAGIARELSYVVRYPVPEEVFVGGVIHDVGKAVMSVLVGAEYADFLRRAARSALELPELEEQEYGYSHSELGARLLRNWAFAPVLVNCALFHHSPVHGDEFHEAAALVYVADRLAAMPPDVSFTLVLGGPVEQVMSALGLNRRLVAEAYHRASAAHEELRQVFTF